MALDKRLRLIDKDRLTLAEYLETAFLEGFDYGEGASGWNLHHHERRSRENGLIAKPRLSDRFVKGLDSIPWGVFEQALADAHTKAPDIVEPYLKTYLQIPRRPLSEALRHYSLTYQTIKRLRRDAIALIRGCLPIKARRIIATVEKEREEEDRLLAKMKKALRKEAEELLRDVLKGD